jgi:site-specific recombinase XerD
MYQRDTEAYNTYAYTEELDWLDPDTLIAWRDGLNTETKKSPYTINRMLSSVRSVIRELATRKMIDEMISIRFDRIDGVKIKRNRDKLKENARTLITPEEMRMICNTPNASNHVGRRDRALLAILASSGVKVAELTRLELNDLKVKDGEYVLIVTGKTNIKQREAQLSKEAYKYIKDWLDKRPIQSKHIFTSFKTRAAIPEDKPISETAVWNIVTHYAEACGLPNIKPHDFRRFVGTQLAKQDIRKAQKALGHKNIETTARHYVLDELEVGLTDDLY